MIKPTRATTVFTILSTAWLWVWAGPGVPAQQPKPADADEPPVVAKVRPILKAKPVEPSKNDDELKKLLKARYNTAVRLLRAAYDRVESGRDTPESLFQPFRLVHDAGIELYDKLADQIAMRELYLEIAKEVEKFTETRFQDQRISVMELESVRYQRLTAEIELIRAKKKLKAQAK